MTSRVPVFLCLLLAASCAMAGNMPECSLDGRYVMTADMDTPWSTKGETKVVVIAGEKIILSAYGADGRLAGQVIPHRIKRMDHAHCQFTASILGLDDGSTGQSYRLEGNALIIPGYGTFLAAR